jgi:hypothetical protein
LGSRTFRWGRKLEEGGCVGTLRLRVGSFCVWLFLE